MQYPVIFGPVFRGETWHAWRVFLKALFGLPLAGEELSIYQRHTGRELASKDPVREAWQVVGRRRGRKSQIAALLGVFFAAFKDYRGVLEPGEVATIMIIASDRRQARVILCYVRGFLDSVPMLTAMVAAEPNRV